MPIPPKINQTTITSQIRIYNVIPVLMMEQKGWEDVLQSLTPQSPKYCNLVLVIKAIAGNTAQSLIPRMKSRISTKGLDWFSSR